MFEAEEFAHGGEEIGVIQISAQTELFRLIAIAKHDLIFSSMMGGGKSHIPSPEDGFAVPKDV
jgi:hypothetical protein